MFSCVVNLPWIGDDDQRRSNQDWRRRTWKRSRLRNQCGGRQAYRPHTMGGRQACQPHSTEKKNGADFRLAASTVDRSVDSQRPRMDSDFFFGLVQVLFLVDSEKNSNFIH